jgi:hypothetical protein
MMPGRLNRLRRMTFDEGRWRASELARTFTDRIRARLGTPQWRRGDIARALAHEALDGPTRDAIGRQDWASLNDHLADRLTRRPSRCVIDPSLADSLRCEVVNRWPAAVADASARGDRILAGQYDLLGYRGLRFADWHSDPVHRRHAPRICWAEVAYLDPAVGDHKIIWELNRHQHWLQLGRAWWLTRDERYARATVDRLESWLAENPPLTGINWSSMLEIGFRTISWTMAIHMLLSESESGDPTHNETPLRESGHHLTPTRTWLVDAFIGIDRQLRHVEHHLSYYFSPNTHLTGEALALYVVGQAFPELAGSKRWVATGRRILLQEIERQILPDGGHAERSTHYQRYTLDFYLLALLTARRAADVDGARTFATVATQLAEFTRAMADDAGRLPLIGDDDGGMLWPIAGRECNDVRDSLAVAALTLGRPDLAPWGIPEEAFWIAAPEAMKRAADLEGSAPQPSVTLADTGYVVLRADAGDHAVLDAGAHGYMNGGHAHADALSLTLQLGTRPLLVDPGTSTYTMDSRLRDRMRGSFNHNTVALDDRPQSTPAGPFHWKTTATGRLHASRHNAGFDWVEAVHDGYTPIEHRRSIVRADGAGFLVVDELRPESADGGGRLKPAPTSSPLGVHSAAAHWHFDPGWMVRSEHTGRLRATHMEGDQAWLLFDAGDVSLLHGDAESGLGWFAPVYGTLVPTWTARIAQTSRLPFSMITWIGESPAGMVPSLERLDVTADPSGEAIAARVVAGDIASTYLIRPGEPATRDGRACGILDYQTNARVIHFRTRGDSLVALDLADASHALALRNGWLSVAASEPMRDLHATIANGMLHLVASEPPRELRVEGSSNIFLITARDWSRSPSSPLFRFGAPFALDEVRPERCEEIWPLRESSW